MSKLSTCARDSLVQKALLKNSTNEVREIAKAHNIGYSTLQRWIKCYQDDNIGSIKALEKAGTEQTIAQRLQHIIATAAFDETAIGCPFGRPV